MNAELILENVRKTYLSCKSYLDRGQVTDPDSHSIMNFHTSFERSGAFSIPYFRRRLYKDAGIIKSQVSLERPKKVRFEFDSCFPNNPYCSKNDQNVIWSNGKKTYMKFSDEIEHSENIDMAVASATGISRGAATMILRMLMPEIDNGCGNWFQMRNPIVKNIELVGALASYHIVGQQKFADDTEAWINKEDLLVTRILKHHRVSAEEELKYRQEMKESLRSELKDDNLDDFFDRPFEDRSYTTEYNYHEVKINEKIPASVFKQ